MAHIHEKIDFSVSVYAVYEHRVLLVLHKKVKAWLPLGGHIKLDEDPDEALLRKVREESGLEIEVVAEKRPFMRREIKSLYRSAYLDIHKINETHRHIGFTYFARAKTDHVRLAGDEHDDIRWFDEDELADPRFGIFEDVQFYAREALKKCA